MIYANLSVGEEPEAQNPKPARTLVKSIHIYSNGDTLERSYNRESERPASVATLIANTEQSTLRLFSNHLQLFTRVVIVNGQFDAQDFVRQMTEEIIKLSTQIKRIANGK